MNYSQVYSVKSNARRAARAAGVDPDKVTACAGGFHFPVSGTAAVIEKSKPETETSGKKAEPTRWYKGKNGYDKAQAAAAARAKSSGLKPDAFSLVVSFVHGRPEYGFIGAGSASDYQLATGKEKPKAEAAKPKADKPAKRSKRAKPGEGQDKLTETKRLILRANGATMDEIIKATGWLPHTARARISGIAKADKLDIDRTRLLGVTTYKATPKKKAA